DPALYDSLKSAPSSQRVEVSIWLNISVPIVSRSRAGTASASMSARNNELGSVKAFVAPRRAAIVDALTAMGGSPEQPVYAPAVFAKLTPAQIRKVASRSDVSLVYGQTKYRLFQEDAATTERVMPVWAAGILGGGTRPAIHEPDGVSSANPALNN